MEGPCADSVEKREPASDLAIVVVDSLKRLTPTGRLEKRTRAVQQLGSLFDNVVRDAEQRRRQREPEHPSGRMIDNQLKLARLHYW